MTQTQNCWSITIAHTFFNFSSYVAQEVGNGICGGKRSDTGQ